MQKMVFIKDRCSCKDTREIKTIASDNLPAFIMKRQTYNKKLKGFVTKKASNC